jgi:mevalonate kinase
VVKCWADFRRDIAADVRHRLIVGVRKRIRRSIKTMEEQTQEQPKEKENLAFDLIKNAHTAAERLEKANLQTLELIKKQEELQSMRILGGKSEGAPKEEKPKEISNREYAKAVLQGRIPPK